MPALLCLFGALLGCAGASAKEAASEPGPQHELGARLERALRARGFEGAALSVLVVDRRSGKTLFARDPDLALVPASTQKLLTAVGALSRYGPAHRFETRVLSPRAPDSHGAVEDLVIMGADPSMTSEQWWRLAADLRAAGLRRVRGDLVLDDHRLDTERWHPSWQPVSARAYHAPVGALSANYGAFRVVVSPGPEPGSPAKVLLDPPLDYFEVVATARTGTAGSRPTLQVARSVAGARERIEVSGSLAAGGEPRDIWRSVARPARYAGAVLRLQLAANGIPVEGRVRPGRLAGSSTPLWEHRFEGFQLARISTLFLKYSNNFIAEVLLKTMGIGPAGEPGSWPLGVRALSDQLASLGVSIQGAELVDGSGLSRDNRVPARLLVDALGAADRQFGFSPELLAALPMAGLDGTLEERAEDARGRVRGKTGTLEGVTSLAGLARDGRGREMFFAILVNGYRRGDVEAMAAVDRFAAALGE